MNRLGESSPQEEMIRRQLIERGIRDTRVIDAIRAVPRELFFHPDARDDAFADRAAPIGHGQTISQPYIVALMTSRLDIRPESKILEIGTGSGYQTAILAQLAREVFTVERVKPLLDEAWEKLMSMGIRNVHFRHADGSTGWRDAAPFDRIIVTAGAPRLPVQLLHQLADGGIAVLPVGAANEQKLLEVRRSGQKMIESEICPCRFVKLIGTEGWAEER